MENRASEGDRHDYRLCIDLINNGNCQIGDWRVRLEISKEFAPVGQGSNDIVTIQKDSANLPADEAKLYPGDRKANALPAAYYVDERNYDRIGPDKPAMKLSVWSGNALTWSETITLSMLNEF